MSPWGNPGCGGTWPREGGDLQGFCRSFSRESRHCRASSGDGLEGVKKAQVEGLTMQWAPYSLKNREGGMEGRGLEAAEVGWWVTGSSDALFRDNEMG